MATVTTPSGRVLENVLGDELEYYRGEANTVGGYEIVEGLADAPARFPQVFVDGKQIDVDTTPTDEPVGLTGEKVEAQPEEPVELTGQVENIETGERTSVLEPGSKPRR